ncbi:6338_t:CDS:2 [Dentiscutata heterogama]|uniref:6338_t:CDS:1 n=1 Tax=Dentiscutata heterogama TaxID=1316150 RepID=A0ACA9NX83_9GLOM|nr:6338_t:CDS:2 [Dentiscutata heterogama]
MDSHETSKKALAESNSPTTSGSSPTPAQPSSPTPSNASTGSTKKDKDASTSSTPASSNGSTSGKSSKNVPSSTPAINIFSNDGSFLDRFKKMKAEEDEKKKQLGALERKKAFEDRIKNRGKRKNQPTDEEPDPKRVTLEDNERDDSGHVRPLVK